MKRTQLKPIGMWVTPTSQEHLQQLVEDLGTPEAIHAMMYTWNYFTNYYKDKEKDDENGN